MSLEPADFAAFALACEAMNLRVPDVWRTNPRESLAVWREALPDVTGAEFRAAVAILARDTSDTRGFVTLPKVLAVLRPHVGADPDAAWGLCRRLRDLHEVPPLPPGESAPWPLADDSREALVRWLCLADVGGIAVLRSEPAAMARWRDAYAARVEQARRPFVERPSRYPGMRPDRRPVSPEARAWAANADPAAALGDLKQRVRLAGGRWPQDPTEPAGRRAWTLPHDEGHDVAALYAAIQAVGWSEIWPARDGRDGSDDPASWDASVSAKAASFRRAFEAASRRARIAERAEQRAQIAGTATRQIGEVVDGLGQVFTMDRQAVRR